MLWDARVYNWNEYYKLAKEYYKNHGNLNIPYRYKTINNIKLGEWIRNQRKTYIGKGSYRLTKERTELLNKIEMIWFTSTLIFSKQEINANNRENMYAELLRRFNKLLKIVDFYEIKSKDDVDNINQYFLLSLSRK